MRRSTRRSAALAALACVLAATGVLAPATAPGGGPLTSPAAAQAAQCEEGELIADPGWAPDAIGLAEARSLADGAGVLVAVVDSGVQPDFPHLVGAVQDGTDVVALDPTNTTGTHDTFGHGSAVATIIAGRTVEGSGLEGIAPAATIVPIRVYYEDDSDEAEKQGIDPKPERIAEGVRRASATGAKVIVVAMSTISEVPELAQAVADATAGGALVVASAGNVKAGEGDPSRLRYPAAYPEVLAVGAYDRGFTPVASSFGDHVDIGGPGVGILATGRSGSDCRLGAVDQATSWATAHVAGVATLVAQLHPEETPAQWAHRLTATAARPVPDERSPYVGWGLVQAGDALGFVDDGSARGPASGAVPVLERPVPEAAPVVIVAYPDAWARARGVVAWWALGAAVVVAGCLIVTRMPRRRDQDN